MLFYRKLKEKLKEIRVYGEGSVTVEMSILFPIILFVILTVLLFTFYVNDIVCIRATVNQYAVIANNLNKTNNDIVKELQEELKEVPLIVKVKEIQADKKENKTKIKVKISFKSGFWNMDRHDTINVTMHSEDNTSFVVKAKVLFDIAEEIKGG